MRVFLAIVSFALMGGVGGYVAVQFARKPVSRAMFLYFKWSMILAALLQVGWIAAQIFLFLFS
jgi:hypothetical protein